MRYKYWYAIALLTFGLGLGIVVAEFIMRWLGRDGVDALSMVGAALAWLSVFVIVALQQKTRSRPIADAVFRRERSSR